jgi:hypothetical protein
LIPVNRGFMGDPMCRMWSGSRGSLIDINPQARAPSQIGLVSLSAWQGPEPPLVAVLAIAEHEHMPEATACGVAEYLLNEAHGPEKIRDMIVDDVRAAQARGDREHVRTLLHVLHHFLKAHPQALPPEWGHAAPSGVERTEKASH